MSEEKLNIYLKLLTRAKNGDFAEIEEESLIYSRINEETNYIDEQDENYMYSIN